MVNMTRALVCFYFCAACAALAQTADAPPVFEVASIKPSVRDQMTDILGAVVPAWMRGGPGTRDPGQISFTNASLKTLIANAYGVKPYQISGPTWLDVVGFNIIAKVPPGTSKEQLKLMLQNLLAERFKLTLHHEKKELPVYALVVAKNGPKMKVSEGPDASGSWGQWNDSARWVSPNETMPHLADFLSPGLDRPVIDATGLAAKYDVTLYWAPENMRWQPTERNTGVEAVDPAPTIFAAVQQQLGLKLEPRLSPMDILVIDHAEKTPTEN